MAIIEPLEIELKNKQAVIVKSYSSVEVHDMWKYRVQLAKEAKYILTTPDEIDEFNLEKQLSIQNRYLQNPKDLWILATDQSQVIATLNFKSFNNIKNLHVGQLGMGVLQKWQGQGLGEAMMKQFLKWFHSNQNLVRVELDVMCENIPAYNLYKKLGFIEEGRKLKAYKNKNGVFTDSIFMAYVK